MQMESLGLRIKVYSIKCTSKYVCAIKNVTYMGWREKISQILFYLTLKFLIWVYLKLNDRTLILKKIKIDRTLSSAILWYFPVRC